MVVCNTPLMPIPHATCPITPATLHPFAAGLCSLSPVSAVPCSQRYPQTTILTSGQMLTPATAHMPGITNPPTLRCTQTPSPQTSPNSSHSSCSEKSNISCSVVASNCNAILTYTPVPTNIVPITNSLPTLLPYSPTTVVQCKVPTTTTTPSVIQCNQGIYTQPTNAIVPYHQRIVNGSSVLQCAPGICQITPTNVYPNGSVEMCPLSSTQNTSVYPVTPSVSIAQSVCTATAASTWKQSYGMEQVWQCEFRTLFLQYAPHIWMLLPVNQKPTGIWHANVDSAKVRFCCEDCGHGWTSMKGRVAFWFILNPSTNEGVVCLKLYGQQCDRCKTGNYEPAMWYPEEVIKVLVNIYNRVGQVYYGFTQAPYHKARRPGKPRTPHNSELCQACKDGVCAERR